MAMATGRVDEFVKDYLTFRGLATTLKAYETELKNEKEKTFRADKMIEQLTHYVTSYDISNLREYWNFLNGRLFSRLEQRYMSSVRKLEVGLLKYYLVHASQSNKQDKIQDFFERMTEILQNQPEFKEWFAFPFVRNPEDNPHFTMYFTRQWQETFFLSLYNFLSVILQAMPVPVLLNFEADYRQLKKLQEENEALRQQILSLGHKPDVAPVSRDKDVSTNWHVNRGMDLVYDFSSLGGDTAIPETQNKSPRRFLFSSSPLNIGRKSDKQALTAKKKEQPKDDVMKMSTRSTSARGGSKLLPVITRQKKSKSVVSNQSNSSDTSLTNQMLTSEPSTSQKAADLLATNQKHRKQEEVKQELQKRDTEGTGSDKSSEVKGDIYTRSQSVPASEVNKGHKQFEGARRAMSKVEMSTQPVTKSSSQALMTSETGGSPGSSLTTVSSLTSSTAATMKTSVSGDSELQAFPLPSSTPDTQSTGSDPGGTSQKVEIEDTKPFLLLSQDEYSEHGSSISYCRFSNIGQYVASVDVDGVVKVWQWSPQPTTSATVMSKSAFLTLEWASKSDRWLLLGNRSGNIRLFDVKEMKSFYEATGDTSYPRVICLCANPASPSFVCAATVSRNRSGSIGADTGPSTGNKVGKLMLWDLKTMKADKQLPLAPGPVGINCCAFNHNGQLLVTGGVDGQIRLFDVQKQKCIKQWSAHTGEVRGIHFSSDETACYSIGMDNTMIQWSVNMLGTKLNELPVHQGAAPQFLMAEPIGNKEVPRGKLLAFDNDGEYLLTCDDNKGLIYRLLSQKPYLSKVMDLKCQRSSPMTTVDWSPNIDTKVCLTGYMDGKVRVSTLLSQ